MKNYPSISVLMPVYNCAQYLQEAIESILNQTYQDFEFIIVNDGSTDNTLNILNEYANKDSRIRVINQPNRGIVGALNRGLNEAKGEWIFRMDGDDISLPHRFKVQIEAIKRNPSLVIIGGWCQQINSQGVPLKINKYPSDHNRLVEHLETLGPFFPHPTTCFKRDIVLKLDGYRERFKYAEDFDLLCRLIGKGNFGCIEDVVLHLRKHEESLSCLQPNLVQLFSMAALICYFIRRNGFSDPSLMVEDNWQSFLEWVEKKMNEENYFEICRKRQELRNKWFSNPTENKFKRTASLFKSIIENPSVLKALDMGFKGELAKRLANESLKVFNIGLTRPVNEK